MSLPNYLAKIKSAGIYRFVWDKSVVPPQEAETLRLLVGYSEKGPFNTPVYIDNINDFKSIFGNISKRLERKGVYFHRMAEQALLAGPILALNLKPFDKEVVKYIAFNGGSVTSGDITTSDKLVKDLYDTNRFWKLDADQLPKKLGSSAYFNIAMTDTKDSSCSVFVRKTYPESYKGITFRSWYSMQGIEYPEYMEPILDTEMINYFADIYVFKGKFTDEVCTGSLKKYFQNNGDDKYELVEVCTNAMGQDVDTLEALANDPNSNFISAYTGINIPYFKDANGNYISLDIKFNADHSKHKLMMKMDDALLEDANAENLTKMLVIADNTLLPTYLEGYSYSSLDMKGDKTIWEQCKKMISTDHPGMIEALTNRVDVEYHYVIDTFDSEPHENKAELFALAKTKDNAFAIVNFPKMSKWGNVKTVKEGASGLNAFVMPDEFGGASFGAYYTQLTFSDGSVKYVVPSSALVSNLFMTKWTTRKPYYIVAGPNFGAIAHTGLVGPDYNFSRADLDILEPMGINAIVYVPRLGTYISSNQTAKQVPVSGLSKVHVRELVIYLQNEIERLLQSYQWELNTQPLRDTIKNKADIICENIKNNGGLYAFVNVCDETNNTPEIIDNEMIILDTEIEPARGAGKMVHQLTIHKTGGLTSSVK